MEHDDSESFSDDSSLLPHYDTDDFDFGYDEEIFPLAADTDVSKMSDEKRDFILEGMALLHEQTWTRFMPVTTTGSRNKNAFLSLYNFIATSLVRSKEDVAAVAIYLTGEGAQVYYTKDKLDTEDIAHAESFCCFLERSAKEKPPPKVFKNGYFDILLQNGSDYILDKYTTLRTLFDEKKLQDLQNTITKLSEFLNSLASGSSGTKHSGTDERIAKLLSDRNTGDIYLNLEMMFQSMYKRISISRPTAEELVQLSYVAELISESSPSRWMKLHFEKLLQALEDFSRYSTGVRVLYSSILQPRVNWHWQNIHLHKVECPDPVKYSLCEDSFWVSACIYFRQTGEQLRLTREQFYQRPLPVLSSSLEITTPCEKHLIQHLIKIGQRPVCLGLSRLSCALCMQWIENLNEGLAFRAPRWVVQGNLGNVICQPTDCTDVTARYHIYQHVVCLLDDIKKDIRRDWRDKTGKGPSSYVSGLLYLAEAPLVGEEGKNSEDQELIRKYALSW